MLGEEEEKLIFFAAKPFASVTQEKVGVAQDDDAWMPPVEPEFNDIAHVYTVSYYTLNEVEAGDPTTHGIKPRFAVTSRYSPYRMHPLWVFQLAGESVKRCMVLFYVKINNAEEEVAIFRNEFKKIVSVMDKDFTEIQQDKGKGLKEYVTIEDRMYTCEIMTMDNEIHSEYVGKPTSMLKTTTEEAGMLV